MTEQTRRATRLFRIQQLLQQYPQGLTVSEVTDLVGYSKRTVQRDINALESELRLPIQVVGRRYKIDPEAAPLSPVYLTLHEARALFFGVRLLVRTSDENDPDAVSSLRKLASALSRPVALEIEEAARELESWPTNEGQVKILRTITRCWAASTSVAIRYRSQSSGGEQGIAIDPYLLEPAPNGQGVYVIGYSHHHKAVRTFKLDRILNASASGETFHPQDLPEIKQRLARSWGVVFDGEEEFDIVVQFTPAVAQRVRETNWHASQQLTGTDDGGVRLHIRLPSLLEFEPWVRSWGPEARVIDPPELRDRVAASLRAAADLY